MRLTATIRERRSLLFPLALISTALVISSPVCAQDSAGVALGATLRVRTNASEQWQYGAFAGVAADTLLLRLAHDSPTRRFPLPSLGDIEVREHDAGKQRTNTILGAVLGAAGGALFLHLSIQHCEAHDHHTAGPPCAIASGALPLFIIVGGGTGGAAGASWPVNHWRPVAIIPARSR